MSACFKVCPLPGLALTNRHHVRTMNERVDVVSPGLHHFGPFRQ